MVLSESPWTANRRSRGTVVGVTWHVQVCAAVALSVRAISTRPILAVHKNHDYTSTSHYYSSVESTKYITIIELHLQKWSVFRAMIMRRPGACASFSSGRFRPHLLPELYGTLTHSRCSSCAILPRRSRHQATRGRRVNLTAELTPPLGG